MKRLLSNLNVVAIQNSLDGFRNTLSVRNNSKISRWILLIRSVTSCNWFVADTGENVLVWPFIFRTSETYFLSSTFKSSEDSRHSTLLDKCLS